MAKQHALTRLPGQYSHRTTSRVRIGLLLGAIVVVLMLLGGWPWLLFVITGCWFGFLELNQLMLAKGYQPSKTTVIIAGLGLFTLAALGQSKYFSPMLTACILLSFFRLLFRKPMASIADIGATLLSILYVIYLPLHYILLRNLGANTDSMPWQQPGLGFVFMTLCVISASDIVAYYAGKSFGKHLLYPEISPKKTQEGAVFGIIAGVFIGAIFSWWLNFSLLHGIILSLILTVVGQLGDLSESLLKRDAGLKDSGELLQGHGGLLDRMDSYIFSGAVSYYYIYWIVLQEGLARDLHHLFVLGSGG